MGNGRVVALVALAELITLLALVSGNDDLDPREYEWESSLLDLVTLGVIRTLLIGFLYCCQVRNSAGVGAVASIVGLMGIVGVVKLATAKGIHNRETKALIACWVAFVAPVLESVALLLETITLYRKVRDSGEEMDNEFADDYENMDQEGSGARYTRLPGFSREQYDKSKDKYHGTGANFRRVLSLAWPERYLLSAALVCLVVASASQMIIPALFGKIIETISHTKSMDDLNRTVVMMVIIFIISSIFSMFRGALFNLAGERLVARFRVRVFEAIILQDISFFDEASAGELQSRLSNDTTKIQDACTTNVSMGLRFLAQFVVGLILLFVISWRLTLIMLSVIPALAIGARFFGMYIKSLSTKYQESLAKAGEVAEEAFNAIRTVRSVSKENEEIKRYKRRIMDSYSYGFKTSIAYGTFLGGIGLGAYLAIALVLWYGGRLVIQGDDSLDAAKLTAFLLYTIYLSAALAGMTGLYSSLMSAVGASQRMFELIDQDPVVKTDLAKGENDESLDVSEIVGRVAFEDVSFRYPTRKDVLVLDSISFTCEPGQSIALVGESGGGKSTCINLLLGFYLPSSGMITIDGKDIHSFSTVKLRSMIGVVSQRVTMFNMTIEENIMYGVHRKVSKEELIQAAKEANCYDFIMGFPDQFKTKLGPSGIQVSGGQQQRLAIARAVLKRPKILCADEATSALDSQSERVVQEALEHIMRGRVTLVVAHRLSTIRNAGTILVIDKGKIVERGPHDELMKNVDGVYSNLVSRQLKN